ncbi:vacuolar protein sorting 36 [Tieghemostelium lacteum]|uniref:Vacuolar protein-sorting-associated protein 36 n=1 Tax=Tieghemostelium lacteum TaxID=361077 RepID=A0A151Z8F2_TIELA|nr:vacuolar protein sorting 36 [Tieghemostelium lacteum]|eukprot:KYQ90246.1 vacuolar protein sorting 36 [Tieghemostelium lacteum]
METFFKKTNIENGKPQLIANELIIYLVENVTIYDGEQKTSYQNGVLYLTPFRVVWVLLPTIALSLSHEQILKIESYQKMFAISSSPKINIILPQKSFKFSFHQGKRDEFYNHYLLSIQKRKEFLSQNQPPPYIPLTNNSNNNNNVITTNINNNNNNDRFDSSKAGISGVLKTINDKTQQTDKILNEAFSDLNALMDKAKDMVTLSEKLRITLDKKTKDSSTAITEEEDEFKSFLLQMGIESPVTKKTAGSQYHNELSRQLSEWIIQKQVLTRQGTKSINCGMILLSDLYCIFNRARGIELISPDDLYRACLQFEILQLPLRLRKFDSGVIIVQSQYENDEQMAKEILDIITEKGPITAFDLSKIQQISLSLSTEKLLASEKTGKLCRDETIEGIRFFDNNIFI